jgi:cell division septum initiation protein DivIVA
MATQEERSDEAASVLDGDEGAVDVESAAVELRSLFGLRRRIDDELARALTSRQSALTDADAIVSQAQALASSLTDDARSRADQIEADAQAVADRVQAAAAQEVEQLTEETRRLHDRAEADRAVARQLIDTAKADAEREVQRAKREAEEIVERANLEATDLRLMAMSDAAANNNAMLDDLERVAFALRRSMEGATASLAQILDGVSDARDSGPATSIEQDSLIGRIFSEEPRPSTSQSSVETTNEREPAHVPTRSWRNRR